MRGGHTESHLLRQLSPLPNSGTVEMRSIYDPVTNLWGLDFSIALAILQGCSLNAI